MSFRTLSVLTISKLRVNAIIFVTLILYTFFVFFSFLIYIINFIFLINRRFKDACLIFILIIVCATNNELCTMFAYVFASYMSFSIFFTFSSRFIVFFNFFTTKIMSIRLFFAKNLLNLRVSFSTRVHYLINIIIEIILNAFFF
jgi:hypothetical protein